MRYITVKEASEKWNISTRRVCILCKNGRVLGAVKKSKVWLIPIDAKKPEDARVNGLQKDINLWALMFHPDYVIDKDDYGLSKIEKSVCEIQNKFFSGRLEEAYFGISVLLDVEKNEKTADALIFLKLIIAADLGKKEDFICYRNKLAQRVELTQLDNKREISDIESSLIGYFGGTTGKIKSGLFNGEEYEELMPLICVVSAKKELNRLIKNGTAGDINNLEIICSELENKNRPLLSAYYHIYLAVYLNANGERDSYIYHMYKAVDILLPRGWYTPLAEYSSTIDLSFIKKIDSKAYREIEILSKKIIDNYVKIGVFDALMGGPRQDKEMNIRIGFKILQGKNNEEIAQELGISVYKVKQHINDLGDIVGSSSKKDIKNFVLRNFFV